MPAALVLGAGAFAFSSTNNFKSSPVLASLVASAKERKLDPNEVLLTEGDLTHTGTALYIVASGFCVAKKGTFMTTLYQDSIIGELSACRKRTPADT